MSYPRAAMLAFVVGLVWSAPAAAQPVGTFRWQLQPYCNVLTLVVVYQAGVYTVDGTDDRCGLGLQSGSASGIVFLNPNGTVGFGLTTVLPGGVPVHLEATIGLETFGGTWRDSSGNSGTFVFTPGASAGGTPRPVSAGGVPAGSITAAHLASGAVDAAAIAANAISGGNIIDGSVTGADLAAGTIGATQIAANAITGSNVADGTLSGSDFAVAAIGAGQLAANAVTGATVADGSLTSVDIGDAPRVVSNESPNTVVLTGGAALAVAAVTVAAPAAGRVVVNTSGTLIFSVGSPALVFCSITTGTLPSVPHAAVAQESTDRHVPFGGTRTFAVAAGSSTTLRLVCLSSGVVSVFNPAITAFFIAGS